MIRQKLLYKNKRSRYVEVPDYYECADKLTLRRVRVGNKIVLILLSITSGSGRIEFVFTMMNITGYNLHDGSLLLDEIKEYGFGLVFKCTPQYAYYLYKNEFELDNMLDSISCTLHGVGESLELSNLGTKNKFIEYLGNVGTLVETPSGYGVDLTCKMLGTDIIVCDKFVAMFQLCNTANRRKVYETSYEGAVVKVYLWYSPRQRCFALDVEFNPELPDHIKNGIHIDFAPNTFVMRFDLYRTQELTVPTAIAVYKDVSVALIILGSKVK